MSDNGIIVAIGTGITAGIAVLGFWTKFVIDRISAARGIAEKAQGVAENALQEAVEAKHETREVREALEDMISDFRDRIDRVGSATGEGLAAIRQHVTEGMFFARDKFALKDDVVALKNDVVDAMKEIKAGQLRTDAKIDELVKQIQGRAK